MNSPSVLNVSENSDRNTRPEFRNLFLPAHLRIRLANDGFVVVKNVLDHAFCECLLTRLEQLWAVEGELAGQENYHEPNARRLACLANKGADFRRLATHPLVLDACRSVVKDTFRLSMLNARDASPMAPRQEFHCDTNSFGRPDALGYFSFTAIWMLDLFNAATGATVIVPGSHLSGQLPADVLLDCSAPHPNEVRAFGVAGDLLLLNGHCWHAGGSNTSSNRRRAILAHYLRADHLPPAEFHRQHPSAETLASLSLEERWIFTQI